MKRQLAWSEWAVSGGLIWVIRNAISATGVRTTVTTTRFEQNMIGLTLKKAQPLWLKEKKKTKQANKRNGQRERKSHLVLLMISSAADGRWGPQLQWEGLQYSMSTFQEGIH